MTVVKQNKCVYAAYFPFPKMYPPKVDEFSSHRKVCYLYKMNHIGVQCVAREIPPPPLCTTSWKPLRILR